MCKLLFSTAIFLIIIAFLPSLLVMSSIEDLRENADDLTTTNDQDLEGDMECSGDCILDQDELGKIQHDLSENTDSNPMMLRMVCRDEKNIVFQWTPALATDESISFVMEQRSRLENGSTPWNYLTTTNEIMLKTGDLSAGTEYQFRVRAYNSTGAPIEGLSTSDWICTLQDGYTPGSVRSVRVELKLLNATQQVAIVRWDPAPDQTCQYDVNIYWQNTERTNQRRAWVRYPDNLFEYILRGLEFDANYTVNVGGMNHNGSTYGSSANESVKFLTLSRESACLQYTNYNLNICPPETPEGVTCSMLATGDEDDRNGSLYDVAVTWQPSKHPPPFYVAEFTTWTNNTQISDARRNLTGNVTSVIFSSMVVGFSFEVVVRALSPGGFSGKASVARFRNPAKLPPSNAPVAGRYNVTIVIIVAILAVIIVATVISFLAYQQYLKRKRYEKRCRYFQSLDEKPQIASICVRSKMAVATVDDKWEIPGDSLLQGDVLGEGAFGVVRKGLLQGRARDEPLLEVAVKMVRDEASLDELRQFLQEIEMMKSVGKHQHIVSIIGCCTVAPRLMLVTEYCALGDLQRYLRKEWDRLCSGKLESRDDTDADKESGRVKYAQLALATEGSADESAISDVAAPTKPTMVVNQMYDMEQAGVRYLNEEGLLTSNDLLSFARQITVGMEFLAGNRVVHRDLAARNVLVCANRTVKISDFGLSRDIYEQNVYRKKCMGKLPIKWMAIESLLHQVYTTQSDVWSFGVLLWEIVTLGGNPYPSTQTNHVFQLLRAGYRMECPNNCSIQLYKIMLNCWEAKPRERPTFSQLHARLDELLEGATKDQYLNLDLMVVSASPETSTSTVDQRSSSASTRSRS